MNSQLLRTIVVIVLVVCILDFLIYRWRKINESQKNQVHLVEELPKYQKAGDALIMNMDSLFVLDSMYNGFGANEVGLFEDYFKYEIIPQFDESQLEDVAQLWEKKLLSPKSYYYYDISIDRDSTVFFEIATFRPPQLMVRVVEHRLIYHLNDKKIDAIENEWNGSRMDAKRINKNTLYVIDKYIQGY